MYAIVVFVIFLVVGEWLAAAVTGRDRRAYSVLLQDADVTVGGDIYSLPVLAEHYRPSIRFDPAHVPPRVDTLWYEAAETDDRLILVYYADWSDEIHPQPVSHFLYRLYRQAVYGSARDIEYLQITIDKSTGIVARVRFETAEDGPYQRGIVRHLRVYLDLNPASTGYSWCILETEGDCPVADTLPKVSGVWTADRPLQVGVLTWNHLYTLLNDESAEPGYTETVDAPLRYLTSSVYQEYKLARRSQGDLKTTPDPLPRNLLRLLIWGFGLAMAVFIGFRSGI